MHYTCCVVLIQQPLTVFWSHWSALYAECEITRMKWQLRKDWSVPIMCILSTEAGWGIKTRSRGKLLIWYWYLILSSNGQKIIKTVPPSINGESVEQVPSFKYLGIHISSDIVWSINTTKIKKAQSQLYFLQPLKRTNMNKQQVMSYYRCGIESMVKYAITSWYGRCSAEDKKKSLQNSLRAAAWKYHWTYWEIIPTLVIIEFFLFLYHKRNW